LAGHKHLTKLVLYKCPQVTSSAFNSIALLPQLKELDLSQCKNVSDKVLLELAKAPHLTWLSLAGTKISNSGIEQLGQFKNLQLLDVTFTETSRESVKALKEALPDCKILGYGVR